jgi:hypothetical protein
VNAASGKCLTVQNGSASNNATVLQYSCNNGANERWTYLPVPFSSVPPPPNMTEVSFYLINIGGKSYFSDKQFKIKNVNSGRCLTVKNASTDDGATLLQYDCNSPGSNVWAQFQIA